jgi:hypothetical protein
VGRERRSEQLSRALAALLLVLLALASQGCVHTHVRAYQRSVLADPSMTTGDLAGPAESHVHAVHEGAAGGGSLAESGCGCN